MADYGGCICLNESSAAHLLWIVPLTVTEAVERVSVSVAVFVHTRCCCFAEFSFLRALFLRPRMSTCPSQSTCVC